MKICLVYLFLIFSGFHFQLGKPDVTRWVILDGCWLKVDGSTNINNFSCTIPEYSVPDTILVTRGSQPVLLDGSIRLPVQNFDCANRIMTADLRKTLKVKEFTKLIVTFISISKYPDATTKQETTKGVVAIELAGVSKRFDVDYKIVSAERSFINLVGSRRVNFSDFNITPPRKLGGMIKTNNELSVEFNLRIKVLE